MSAHASALEPHILAYDVMKETRTFDKPLFLTSADCGSDTSERARIADEQVTSYFRQHSGAVYRYLAGVYGYERTAEEVTSEAFLRLYQALRDGESIECPRAWVLTVARRLMLTEIGRARSEVNRHHQLAQLPSTPVPTPDDVLCNALRQEALVRARHTLTKLERRCLELRASGLKPSEIAERVGRDRRRVAEIIMRAVQQLAKKVNE